MHYNPSLNPPAPCLLSPCIYKFISRLSTNSGRHIEVGISRGTTQYAKRIAECMPNEDSEHDAQTAL